MIKIEEDYDLFLKDAKILYKYTHVYSAYDDRTEIADFMVSQRDLWLETDLVDGYEYNKRMLKKHNLPLKKELECKKRLYSYIDEIVFDATNTDPDILSTLYIDGDMVKFNVTDCNMVVVLLDKNSYKFKIVEDFFKFLKGARSKYKWERDLYSSGKADDDEIKISLFHYNDEDSPYFFKME